MKAKIVPVIVYGNTILLIVATALTATYILTTRPIPMCIGDTTQVWSQRDWKNALFISVGCAVLVGATLLLKRYTIKQLWLKIPAIALVIALEGFFFFLLFALYVFHNLQLCLTF